MPIKLDDMSASMQSIPVAEYTPKFFGKMLTGHGGSTPGILSDRNAPSSVPIDLMTRSGDKLTHRSKRRNGKVTTTHIPFNPLSIDVVDSIKTVKRPDMSELVHFATASKTQSTVAAKRQYAAELYFKMKPQAIILEDVPVTDNYGKTTIQHDVRISYELTFYKIFDKTSDEHDYDSNEYNRINETFPFVTHPRNAYWRKYTTNPIHDISMEMAGEYKQKGWKVDDYLILDCMNNYDIYDAVCKRSEEWQDKIPEILEEFLNGISNLASYDQRRYASIQMKYIMTYNIPLERYKDIYKLISSHFMPDDCRAICKQNLNLLLSDTLQSLDKHKAQIKTTLPANVPLPPSLKWLSGEQKTAVTSNEPLILVQSGAGCGKSTLILSRIDYLIEAGVKPEDITVLSFTNAAADHIKEKNVNVQSMTIARMIHEIYTNNFTEHELSSLETIINSIDIYYPVQNGLGRGVVDDFQHRLIGIVKKDPNAVTETNNFIEEHYDEVIDILNTIHQTALELEIIICYQQIDKLIEPADIASKYLIIDEVQDNSVFEFIYTLKYVDKHKEALFIVGRL